MTNVGNHAAGCAELRPGCPRQGGIGLRTSSWVGTDPALVEFREPAHRCACGRVFSSKAALAAHRGS